MMIKMSNLQPRSTFSYLEVSIQERTDGWHIIEYCDYF